MAQGKNTDRIKYSEIFAVFFLEHDSKSPPGKSDLKVLAYLLKAHNDNQMLAVSGQF